MTRKLLSRTFANVHVSLLFEPRDVWVGLYWDVQTAGNGALLVYVCLVPCVPVRIRVDL